MANPNEFDFKKCSECDHFFVCANLYGEVNKDTTVKNIKGEPCFYFENSKVKINKILEKKTYTEWLLPKLKWASSDACDNIDYTKQRLDIAIDFIEELIGIIQDVSRN